jgi:hypothetical protein
VAGRTGEEGHLSQTLRTDTSHLRQFYRLQREGYRDDDPSVRLIMPRTVRGLPRPIKDSDLMFAITSATDRQVKAILALPAFAGLRAGEIA